MSKRGEVIYLHGRGDCPSDPPGDMVLAVRWPMALKTPLMDDDWCARSFSDRVGHVTDWLGSARLAIGHSFGGWLLLCTAVAMFERDQAAPPILLLSSVLGVGTVSAGDTATVFALPPRQASVHRALGLTPGFESVFSPESLEIVHAVDDEQCPVGLARRLAARHRTTFVRGGHRLWSSGARSALLDVLERRGAWLSPPDTGSNP